MPVSGRARGSSPDVAHPVFVIEVKAGAVLSSIALEGMEQAQAAADHVLEHDGLNKLPIVCISNRGKGRRAVNGKYVLMTAETFCEWLSKKGQQTPS